MKVYVFGTRGFPGVQGGVEKHCEYLYMNFPKDIQVTVFRRKSYIHQNVTYSNIRFIDLPSTKIKGIEALVHSFLSSSSITQAAVISLLSSTHSNLLTEIS